MDRKEKTSCQLLLFSNESPTIQLEHHASWRVWGFSSIVLAFSQVLKQVSLEIIASRFEINNVSIQIRQKEDKIEEN